MRTRTAVDGRPAGVVLGIARVEARRLLRHPVVIVATAWTALFEQPYAETQPEYYFQLTGDGVLLLAVVAVVMGALAGSRVRRDRAGELLSTQPAGETGRTAGILVAMVAFALPATLAVVAHAVRLPPITGSWRPSVLEMALGPVLVVAAGVYGVMVGRWFPHVLAGPVAVIAMVLLHSLTDVSNPQFAWYGWLFPFLAPRRAAAVVSAQAEHMALWHGVYLIALIGCGVAAALLRDTRSRRVWALAAASIAAGAIAAILQVP